MVVCALIHAQAMSVMLQCWRVFVKAATRTASSS